MGIRAEYGGKLEAVLNKLVDEKVATLGKEALKSEGYKLVDSLVEKNYEKILGGLAEKLKKDVIDLIDGEDDVK